jgi:hypothetical protein
MIAQGIEVSFRTSSPVGAAPATHGGCILPFKEMSFDKGSQTTQEVCPMFGCLDSSSAPAVYKCISIDARK